MGTTIAILSRVTHAQIEFLVILVGTLALFISERVRIDVAAMITLLALSLTGILTPSEALSDSRASPPSSWRPCS